MLLNCGVGEDSWESLGLQGDPTSPSSRKSVLNIHWKDWCWNWNFNTLATWCEELTHLKRPWCWERLKAGGEGDDRGWNGCMASLTRWTGVWVGSGVGNGREPWRAAIHGVTKSRTQLSDWTELNQEIMKLFQLSVHLTPHTAPQINKWIGRKKAEERNWKGKFMKWKGIVKRDDGQTLNKHPTQIMREIDQIRSVAQLCLTLCDPMNRSTPGLPVHHQLPEFTQTYVHRVSDAIQPSHGTRKEM